ncbi:MAG TPA: murein L,D-transpeptidase catalytic domain family protein [Chitinophagaceae bacterium]|nr:murein L,D-transpeptidase catalytic domain family protein [Chitinophagaceae bacterium]
MSAIFVLSSLPFISFINPRNPIEKKIEAPKVFTVTVNADNISSSLSNTLYEGLNLGKLGLSKEALDYALKGYQKLVDAGTVVNNRYLTIVDFSQSSRKKRFYLLDVQNNKLVHNTFVSHGKNTGIDMAERFSNKMNSEQSSLGFFVTTATYTGKHGLSLRLSGQEAGFNDNAEARGIVVHGAAYVNSARVNSGYMGRSQGCPALPEAEYAKVINIIKNGSVMFIYHPSQNYLQKSALLNG